jgi:hypothetical protein
VYSDSSSHLRHKVSASFRKPVDSNGDIRWNSGKDRMALMDPTGKSWTLNFFMHRILSFLIFSDKKATFFKHKEALVSYLRRFMWPLGTPDSLSMPPLKCVSFQVNLFSPFFLIQLHKHYSITSVLFFFLVIKNIYKKGPFVPFFPWLLNFFFFSLKC